MKYQGFDGTGRRSRPAQVEALEILAKSTGHQALVASTGIGKSGIARTIQLVDGADIITPSNALLDQYHQTYPTANIVKGVDHYETEADFEAAISRFNGGEPSMFNPLSYYYRVGGGDKVVIDEAHRLYSMMRLVHGDRFSQQRYNPPLNLNTKPAIAAWILGVSKRYNSKAAIHKHHKELKKSMQCRVRARKLKDIAEDLERHPDDYLHWYEDGSLVIEPLEVGRHILNQVLGKETILMSATLPKPWVKRLLGTDKFGYHEFDSPIPVENRIVRMDAQGFTSQTDPRVIAGWITQQREKHGNCNTLVHCTYELGAALHKLLPGSHYHERTTKQRTERLFRSTGGIWLAAGSAEGLDLPGDAARLNLIPVLPFANISSPYVSAIRSRTPGEYELDTLITFIQQSGRTTRGIEDWSETVTGDSRLPQLINRCRDHVPKWFLGGLKWS